MATVPSPKTWSVAERLTAAGLNLELRDALNFLLAPPLVDVYRTADKSIANSTWTLLDWDAESRDTDSMHSNSTNNSRLIAVTPGRYLVNINVAFASVGTGAGRLTVRKNSAGSDTGGTRAFPIRLQPFQAANFNVIDANFEVDMAANDYLEAFVFQSSGAALNVVAGLTTSFFQMRWVAL